MGSLSFLDRRPALRCILPQCPRAAALSTPARGAFSAHCERAGHVPRQEEEPRTAARSPFGSSPTVPRDALVPNSITHTHTRLRFSPVLPHTFEQAHHQEAPHQEAHQEAPQEAPHQAEAPRRVEARLQEDLRQGRQVRCLLEYLSTCTLMSLRTFRALICSCVRDLNLRLQNTNGCDHSCVAVRRIRRFLCPGLFSTKPHGCTRTGRIVSRNKGKSWRSHQKYVAIN